MAIVTATVTVDFTANYVGGHRVCWTIQGSGDPYDCTTIVTCVGGGTTCQAIFTADVNTTSCDGTVTFEGYVQATCEDIASLNGRLPFTVDFVPNPTCTRHEFLCAYGEIDSITIIDGGDQYLIGDPVVVTRNGADTQITDAIISIATLGTGVLNTISPTFSGGINYIATEVITVVNTGLGTGATITIDSVDGSGTVLTFTLTTNGSGYVGPSSGWTFTGGSGSGVNFLFAEGVDYDTFGSVLTFNITSGGAYDIAPLITIPVSVDGTGLDVTAHIADCPSFLAVGEDCDNVPFDIVGLQHTEVFAVCTNVAGVTGVVPDEYTQTDTGCCIPADTVVTPTCTDVHIDNTTGGPINVEYVACDGVFTTVAVPATTLIAVCAILDGVLDLNIAGLIITDQGTACT